MKKYLKAPILSTAFSESQKSAKNRFKNILSEKGKVGILITVIIAILVVIATAFISIRNSQNENVIPTITSGEKTNADTSEKQLKVILDNISMWSLSGESKEYDTYGYAITDLDGNGRLEIVTSHCDGTGLYSHNKYYEVNENLNGLVEVSTNLKPEEIETYIMDGASKVFYDKVQDEYHYVFTNVTRNGPAEYLESKYELVMKGENINQTLLASKRTIYKGDGGNGETVIKSANGEELTDEQYERYEYLHYADYEYKLAYLEWIASYNLNEADINMVKTELEKSYDGFKLGIPKVEVELNDEFALTDLDGNKVQLNASVKTINKELIASKYNSTDGFHIREYAYDDLQVWGSLDSYVDDYYILAIETTSPNYKTKRGISVGDSLEKLKEAYPDKLEKVPDVNESVWCYQYSDFISITFNITDGKISKITIENIPC